MTFDLGGYNSVDRKPTILCYFDPFTSNIILIKPHRDIMLPRVIIYNSTARKFTQIY